MNLRTSSSRPFPLLSSNATIFPQTASTARSTRPSRFSSARRERKGLVLLLCSASAHLGGVHRPRVRDRVKVSLVGTASSSEEVCEERGPFLNTPDPNASLVLMESIGEIFWPIKPLRRPSSGTGPTVGGRESPRRESPTTRERSVGKAATTIGQECRGERTEETFGSVAR